MRRQLKNTILTFFLGLFLSPLYAGDWQRLAPGIEYTDLGTMLSPWSHLHAFKINLKKHTLHLATAASLNLTTTTAQYITQTNGAAIGINGGFFDNVFQPLGLRINNHTQLSPLKKISWWGVFFTKNQRAYLVPARQYQANPAIDFAIQGGPRLIIQGHVPRLKPGIAERTAIGINADNHLIIVITDHFPLTTNDLAQRLLAPPLSCVDALNLDGGSSTQLYANFPELKLNVPGLASVSDFVLVSK